MSVINRIASLQNIRSDVPNQELAKELANNKDIEGIKEIADNLFNKDKKIQSDCIKVLYEIGYIAPNLIAVYLDIFLRLIHNKNNRMVWGAMIALSSIADIKAEELGKNVDNIISIIEKGSVITVDAGIKALSIIASKNTTHKKKIFPFLIKTLKYSIPRDVPKYSEYILCCIDNDNKKEFLALLEERKNILSPSQIKRIDKIFKILL